MNLTELFSLKKQNIFWPRYNWYYHTTPQTHVDGRRMYWPRGRVWGGSSSLNAMVYVRSVYRCTVCRCTVVYTYSLHVNNGCYSISSSEF